MYVIIAIIAVILGMFAQRKVAIGVTGIVLIGLFGAFVTIKQPGSHASDVVPAVIGTIAGIVALTFLIRTFYEDNSTRGPARRRASAIGAR
jgi:predicted signal transduction protein with EAL and GGDEF domain